MFKFVNMMMDIGVTRQLDFQDLVPLPCELKPSLCHTALLDCWKAEMNKHYSDPSLFRAMYHAYGWPYLRLGLLKVLIPFSSKQYKYLIFEYLRVTTSLLFYALSYLLNIRLL